ncbi:MULTISPECIES: ectoine synthase [Gimesia]|jgi:L-ectoine synthase|uniref:L-ectoine synthase n=2 Tax=Gimesia TaxID=1649453 RepID=A0A6I6AJ20_9PLAN|nr:MULTISPECIES: ectoine synthase [Gimesia]MBN68208.1 L-ectoine synthase [Gimesia sp.]MCR9233397.1 ectoine synthase [bacterium]QDT22965.1 L-ectoine synthase [Gimesia chilikensis]QDT86872.1 L-ectoine synthase [Gimesia chilikensis]QGQ25200.1 ectoine synthase [Gimesia benthica]
MLVRQLSEIIDTDRDIKAETWNSRRLLLAGDKMGFSLHDTLIHPGTETEIWYQNHLEAVYCIEGEGEIELIPDGPTYPISPGMMYALDKNDRHLLRAKSQLRMVCVFNPPVTGQEVHDENGVYPAATTDS